MIISHDSKGWNLGSSDPLSSNIYDCNLLMALPGAKGSVMTSLAHLAVGTVLVGCLGSPHKPFSAVSETGLLGCTAVLGAEKAKMEATRLGYVLGTHMHSTSQSTSAQI